MNLDLRQLRAMIAVVDEGTFTDAAIALGVSQASVSRSIAALEQSLGVRVLQRTTRQASLTPAGARILEPARRALEEVAAIHRAIESDELRVGFAWSALGAHTTAVQRRWASAHPQTPLHFVQSNTPSAGLSDGLADIAVVRRPLTDRRFETALVGVEARVATIATSDRLARRRTLTLADFAGRTIAVDSRSGTTTEELWPAHIAPAATRDTRGVDEWLTLIASGQAIGLTSEATARQYPRPGIAYRRVRDAPPVPVWLAWWANDPPALAAALVRMVSEIYAPRPARAIAAPHAPGAVR